MELHAHNSWFYGYSVSKELVRLGIGNFVRELRDKLMSVVDKKSNLHLAIYSGFEMFYLFTFQDMIPLLDQFYVRSELVPKDGHLLLQICIFFFVINSIK